jgi:hypothetical protein
MPTNYGSASRGRRNRALIGAECSRIGIRLGLPVVTEIKKDSTTFRSKFSLPANMNVPSLKERQEFLSWGYANHSFEYVVEACNYISSPPEPLSTAVWRIMFAGIIGTYARPFTVSRGGYRLPQGIVPKKHLKLHATIMDKRHKEIVHIDAQDYQADDPQFGNINQVRISVTKEGTSLNVTFTGLAISEIKELSRELLEKAEYHVGKFRRKYITNARLPTGDYKLNLDQNNLPPFIKV